MGEFLFMLGVKRDLLTRTPNPDAIKQIVVKFHNSNNNFKNPMHINACQ